MGRSFPFLFFYFYFFVDLNRDRGGETFFGSASTRAWFFPLFPPKHYLLGAAGGKRLKKFLPSQHLKVGRSVSFFISFYFQLIFSSTVLRGTSVFGFCSFCSFCSFCYFCYFCSFCSFFPIRENFFQGDK